MQVLGAPAELLAGGEQALGDTDDPLRGEAVHGAGDPETRGVKEDALAYHVVTAYKTTKIAKYWRTP